MKTRLGFVSNSSSCSFICEQCGHEFDVDNRGGTPDDWKALKAGICEKCMETHFMCECGKIFNKEAGTELSDLVDIDVYINDGEMQGYLGWCAFTKHACPQCFATNNKFKDDFHEWSKKIANPDYVPTDIDKKILEYVQTKEKE